MRWAAVLDSLGLLVSEAWVGLSLEAAFSGSEMALGHRLLAEDKDAEVHLA